MIAIMFARVLAAWCAAAFLVAAWHLVANAVAGNWGWVLVAAACCAIDAAGCLLFARDAKR